ncbi:MAG: hypothetical protein LW875_07570 [Proteobacteria bacterium]|jgi:hypothetical protein|nr:hypothetical protein [Pseudomonadota bacterium]
MRYISFLVLTLFLATACSPRDPEVISADDKQRLNEQRNKNRPGASTGKKLRMVLPENFDVIAAGAFVDRSLSATEWVQKALQVQAGSLKTSSCERWKLQERSESQEIYLVRFEACFFPAGDLTLNQSGSYQVQMSLSGAQVTEIRVTSSSFEQGLLTPEFELKRKNFRGSLKWKEELNLVARKFKVGDDSSAWQLTSVEQKLMGTTRSESNDQNWQLLISSDGEMVALEQAWVSKEWHSFVRFYSIVEGGDETFFDLVVTNQNEIKWAFQPCQQVQAEFDYRLNFGPKSKNKATVVMQADGLRDKAKPEVILPVLACGNRLPILFESLLLQAPK